METEVVDIFKEVQELARIEITNDIIKKVDIGSLAPKIKESIDALGGAEINLDSLIKKNWFELFLGSFGSNDRTLANAEKAIVQSAKINIALSLLTVMFSKAIKGQQDIIKDQQDLLKENQSRLKEQQDDILKLQGLTKEQADKIVEILSAEKYLNKQLRILKDELIEKIETSDKELSNSMKKNKESIESRLDSELKQNSIFLKKDFKQGLDQLHQYVKNGNRYYIAVISLLIISNILLWFFK